MFNKYSQKIENKNVSVDCKDFRKKLITFFKNHTLKEEKIDKEDRQNGKWSKEKDDIHLLVSKKAALATTVQSSDCE